MANKNATYVIEFTLRDSAQQRHITTDESENVIVSVSTDGADFTASGATVSAVKKNNALTGIYKVSLQLTGNAVGVLIEHPTLYPYPDFIWIATEQGRFDSVRVGGYAVGEDPANYVLSNPSNKLLTDASGRVTVGAYATGQAPNELVLATPANKLATDASGRVTVGSNADKTGYTLASGEHTQIQSVLQAGMTAQGYTPARAPKLDNLDAAVTSRAAPGDAMSLTSTERSNIASAVWNFMAELSVTAVGLLRLIAAVVQGKRTVDGNTETYYGLDGTTARVVGSVDERGNRNITTRNP